MAEKEFIGGIKKCPSCGTALESFQARCPSCGLELSSVTVNKTVGELAKKYRGMRESGARYFELQRFIENYPIPNGREDFLEFFIFAYGHEDSFWTKKMQQVYTKARIAMPGEPELLEFMKELMDERSADIRKQAKAAAKSDFWTNIRNVVFFAGLLAGAVFCILKLETLIDWSWLIPAGCGIIVILCTIIMQINGDDGLGILGLSSLFLVPLIFVAAVVFSILRLTGTVHSPWPVNIGGFLISIVVLVIAVAVQKKS